MPKSLESSNTELGSENQVELAERGLSAGKKYRHQNYSKNIYIGTKNAEKWELTRTKLSFKNDVEFVTYLLALAENDFANNDGRRSNNIGSNFPIHSNEQNANDKLANENSTDDVDKPRIAKKVKKVHFADSVNGLSNSSKGNPDFAALRKSEQSNFSVLCHNSQDAQDNSISSTLDTYHESNNIPEVLDCRIAEKIKSEMEQKFLSESEMLKTRSDEVLCLTTTNKDKTRSFDSVKDAVVEKKSKKRTTKCSKPSPEVEEYQVQRNGKSGLKISKVKPEATGDTGAFNEFDDDEEDDDEDFDDKSDLIDSDREDEYDFESDDNNVLNEGDDEDDENSLDNESEAQTFNFCRYCSEIHVPEECPFRTCQSFIADKIDFITWTDKYSSVVQKAIKIENSETENADILSQSPSTQTPFSECSLPDKFELKLSNAQVSGVIAKSSIPKYTKLGPLIGQKISEVDIADDCTMKFIIEAYDGTKSTYYSLDDENNSNWLRYIRPANTKTERNVAVVISDKNVFFVTSATVEDGDELVYWSDDCNSAWGKKKIEKMNCGGCNLKFDHPLYYRNHCSIFHDPSFSLTIRKYHCKICGASVLGKENITKHAAQMHDGKGAYQCQFCKKFFLRLNYLEMHRTYGCSANPQRARPLCDFCGRKFCQPQKLKVHIKRMHSDMADVLRDFQCKLCSKLLGSRAALQRHSKEVHSRNSAVVSCPRCQKLFQNRSNLKIHMLTHSGVRPFKCIEGECNAAFTTKQCLQFHYKKVHNYAQEQMPKIERSVAYTFDAYSGGMKVEYLEQAPRKRRKSSDDQNSVLSSVAHDKSETEFSEDNIFENFKKSGKTISNLCKTESNLSLLSSRISSILEHGIKQRKKDRKPKAHKLLSDETAPRTNSVIDDAEESVAIENKAQEEFLQTFQKRQQSKQLSLIESFLSTAAPRTQDAVLPPNDNGESDYKANEHDTQIRDLSVSSITNPIASKGSRKWMSTENPNRENDSELHSKLSQPNRDFLTRLIMNESQHEDDDENSTFLDVVDNGQTISQYSNSIHPTSNNLPQLPHLSSLSHLHAQPFGGPYYNNPPNCSNRNSSSSASMLVEAALSSVGNMMNVDNDLSKNSRNDNHLDNNDNMNNSMDIDMASLRSEHNNSTPQENRFIQNMSSIENEIKMMKNLTNFSLQIPHFDQSASTINNQTPTHASPIDNNLPQDDIDVDTASTPHTIEPSDKLYQDNDNFVSQHQTPPTPHVLSPGRDYAMYNSSNNVSSPISQLSRRNYPEHELISPASSPALPRYSYRQDICRKRDLDEQVHNMSVIDGRNSQHHMSSDDENSIMAQNLSMGNHNGGDEMRLKFSATQMELMYSSKYENGTGNDDISDLRSKYMDQNVESGFRSNGISDGLNDMQGLDMTSRTNLSSGFHHNFQLASSNSNLNIGRYHHHIYDILSEREQQQEQLQQQHQQHMQHMLQDQMSSEQEQDQTTSVDLSLMTSRQVVSSQTSLPYSHSEMLRMASLDLAQNATSGMISNRTFLSPHNSREGLDHHRFLSSADQRLLPNGVASDHRLLVDPTAHLLMEQNSRHIDSRLLSAEQPRIMADSTTNRHMVSPRGFGAYQVSTTNYHHSVRPLTSPSHHSVNPPNYHPFPSFY
ncbi:uncharacterized protein LOC119068311 isoform X1 [Bradysia coprophila]|uniref:uncharacterized protein LOC119068311 isoform X1 n=1 Tax=Bradysia coprophila TaxID=38358 RepID=UPI00187DC852|nr:uncharacterized protein LOC119068311 isoform X1 [Bradysia coprophila]